MRSTLRRLAVLAALACLVPAAQAVLKPGDVAPPFSTEAARGGKAFKFELAEALSRGPVVLYFFPKAFTQGCTYEAHQFAEASERFAALGASVVGVSADNIETLKRFSVEACRDKFAVAVGARIIRPYEAQIASRPDMADRISYVIAPNGKIVNVHHDGNPDGHVESALKAVEKLGLAPKR